MLFCWNFMVSHCLQWQLETSAWDSQGGHCRTKRKNNEHEKSSLEKTDTREAPINSWLHDYLCFLESNYLHHFGCWQDLFFVVGVVIEASGNGMSLHGCKQLSAIVFCMAISLLLQLIWEGKGNGTTTKKPAGYLTVIYVIANTVRWCLILILWKHR